MGFDKDTIRPNYSTEESSLLSDFYIPSLSESVEYDRAVGYFSPAMLTYALQGLDGFVRGNGKMRLVIGEEVSDDEYEAIKEGVGLRETYDKIEKKWDEVIEHSSSELLQHRLDLLSWLVANEHIEIKFAIRRVGMYHEKMGVMRDANSDCLVFQGSANETKFALLPDFNFESISVYPSWKKEVFEDYAVPYIRRFESLWKNRSSNTIVVDIPSTLYDRIRGHYTRSAQPPVIEKELYDSLLNVPNTSLGPELPKTIGGNKYELREHQKRALEEWRANDFQGIMALATGAGKTITAIHAAVQISKAGGKLAVVVAVPYQVLADQWCDVFGLFNIKPVKCYRSSSLWKPRLEKELANFRLLENKNFLAIVVVNATLKKDLFLDLIGKIDSDQLYFIGDECHHHASESIINKLPAARFRMGLSATPWSSNEDDEELLLTQYYGGVVARYTIDQAIDDDVLTGYRYNLHKVYMNDEELEKYTEVTDKINTMVAMKEQGNAINHDVLTMMFMKRARLLGSLEDKFKRIVDILQSRSIGSHTLFYCGDGSVEMEDEKKTGDTDSLLRDIERIAMILHERGWKTSKFTAEETQSDRGKILVNFKSKIIDAIVAIRVLDEGFDVPACREAFLLASSRNERQFVQRRGRILRKSPGKNEAVINDFIVLPRGIKGGIYTALVEKELARAGEFMRVAVNKEDAEIQVREIANEYLVDFDEICRQCVDRESDNNGYK